MVGGMFLVRAPQRLQRGGENCCADERKLIEASPTLWGANSPDVAKLRVVRES